MKQILLLLALISAVWALPQPKYDWEDFPMKRMFVEEKDLNDPSFPLGSRILNGREVAPHEIPYQTWLIARVSVGGAGWTCGGSIITKRYILTAAHCIRGAALAENYIGAHDVTISEPQRIIIVSTRLIIHPNYIPSTITNDVGLIDLGEQLTLSRYINIVKLPRRRDLKNLFQDHNVRVSGWGLTVGGGSRSNVLLAVNSTVLPNYICRSVFSIFEPTELCISGQGGVGSCNGDSGGPLVAGDIQVGIVSYGRAGCLFGYPSVFARVTSFLDWIAENSDYKIED